MPNINQKEFSSILYDSLFGLILFFSLDSFLDIKDYTHFAFYLFSTIIVIHWWLLFKAAEDIFKETRSSAIHILINLGYIILLEFMILSSKNFDYLLATIFILALLILDTTWAIFVKVFHKWRAKSPGKLRQIKTEIKNIVHSNVILVAMLIILVFLSPLIPAQTFVSLYIASYLFYIILSFKLKIINLKII